MAMGVERLYRHLGTRAIGGTHAEAAHVEVVVVVSGPRVPTKVESQHLQLEGPRARARRGRRDCCRSTDVEEFDHRGSRVAATAAHRGGARCESRDSARGRPSLSTSVTVIGLNLAAPN
eukprot:scaffold9778_cov111-Isochrysis_galbana.AAC.8